MRLMVAAIGFSALLGALNVGNAAPGRSPELKPATAATLAPILPNTAVAR